MPQKQKIYPGAKFSAPVLLEALGLLTTLSRPYIRKAFRDSDADTWTPTVSNPMVTIDDEEWTLDCFEEFLAEYRRNCQRAHFKTGMPPYGGGIEFHYWGFSTQIAVTFPSRAEVERIFDVFEANLAASLTPKDELEEQVKRSVGIFLGHGRDQAWRDLRDHLQDQQGFRVIAYETGVRAGKSIQAVLQEMVAETSLAFLIHTAEDTDLAGGLHARENVIHETGLFQGRLGFERAIIIREEGCEEFSNIAGINELRFSRGNIREVFGEVVAIVRQQFGMTS